MRLRRLDLIRYGKFTDHSLDFGERVAGVPDLHIIYGLNEAGKSTALAAYLDLLFGIEERTQYAFLHEARAMAVGACLEFDGSAHEFRRIKRRANSLLDESWQPVNEATLAGPLAGLTRESYRLMFSLDDQTLEEGGNAILDSKGNLGELLFSASAGLSGLNAALEGAVTEADGIFRKRASTTRIAKLRQQLAELKSRRDEIDTQASAYRALAAALQQADSAYVQAVEEIGTVRSRQEEIAGILRAAPLAVEYQQIGKKLEEAQCLPQPPAEWAGQIADLVEEETRLNTRLAEIMQREERARQSVEEIAVDAAILALGHRLEGLPHLASRYMSAEKDLPKRRAALEEVRQKLDLILASLGKAGHPRPADLLVPTPLAGALRDLIAAKSGIDVALQAAEKEYEAAIRALDRAKQMLSRVDADQPGPDPAGRAALEAILRSFREKDLLAEERFASRELSACRQAFAEAIEDLRPWTGDGDDLRRIDLPEARRLEQWRSRAEEIERRLAHCIERLEELSARLDEDRIRLMALREAGNVPDDELAATLQRNRDEAWAEHLGKMDAESAGKFERSMRELDAVAATRLAMARQLEEMRSLMTAVTVAKSRLERQKELQGELDAELETLRKEIRSETPVEIGLGTEEAVTSWIARIEHWSERRAVALDAWKRLQQAVREAEAARTALEHEQGQLSRVLGEMGHAVEGLPLAARLQLAENTIAEQLAIQTRKTEIAQRVQELEATGSDRRKDLEGARRLSDQWQANWAREISATWFADLQDSVGAVRGLLDQAAALPEALRELDDLGHRIEAMELDRQHFRHEVAELYSSLGESLEEPDPLVGSKLLLARHERARQDEVKRKEWQQLLAELSVERQQVTAAIARHARQVQPIYDFLEVDSLVAVREILDRCRLRDELVARQRVLAQQILAAMRLSSVEEAMDRLAGADYPALQAEQAMLASQLENLEARSRELFADRARASDGLNAIGGDDAVARIENARRTALLEIEDLAVRYLRIRAGRLTAEEALRAYRDKHRSTMLRRASEAFRQMTSGAYEGLATRPDRDREELMGIARNGASKLAAQMSKGTRFQLYLALRMAGHAEFAAVRPAVPFIADDIMETFDEPRSAEVLRLCGQMGMQGQVIYLTHHRHLRDLALEVVPDVRVHEIA